MGLEFVWQDMTTPAVHQTYRVCWRQNSPVVLLHRLLTDLKRLPSRLLVPADPVRRAPRGDRERQLELAIEVWALYSSNLHKATFHGLEALESRKG